MRVFLIMMAVILKESKSITRYFGECIGDRFLTSSIFLNFETKFRSVLREPGTIKCTLARHIFKLREIQSTGGLPLEGGVKVMERHVT